MNLPHWVEQEIAATDPPSTGKVVIELETYMGGVTSCLITGGARKKAPKWQTADLMQEIPHK